MRLSQTILPSESAQVTRTKSRIVAYIAISAVLVGVRFLAHDSSWQGNLSLHNSMGFAATLTALFAGILALVRFYTKKDNTFLFIGTGLIGAGLLDGYHTAVNTPFLEQIIPFLAPPSLPWSWNVSRTFLSILLFGSWLVSRRDENISQDDGARVAWMYVVVGVVVSTNVIFFALVPQPPSPELRFALGRVETFLSAIFFLLALAAYVDKGDWRHDAFEHWLVLALLVSLLAQVVFMFFFVDLFDAMFDIAHGLKQVSYLSVLIGLLTSMYSIFKQAESTAAEISEANQALHKEIVERRRAEAAEHEQRQLAEALRQAGIAMSATLDFEDLLDCLLDQIAHVLPYDTANVMLVAGDDIRIVCTRGYEQFRMRFPEQFASAEMPSLQYMAATGQPLVIPDTLRHPQWVKPEASPHVRSWAGAPIAVQQVIVAFVALNHHEPNTYKPQDAGLLTAFAGQAAIAVQNAHLYEEVQMRVEEQTTLNELNQALNATLDLRETLMVINSHAMRFLDATAAVIALREDDVEALWIAAACGELADRISGSRTTMGDGIIGQVAETGEPVLVTKTAGHGLTVTTSEHERSFPAHSILSVPLQTAGQVIGALEVISKKDSAYNEADLRLLTLLSRPAATAIENAQLYQQAQQEIADRKRAEAALEAERALLASRVEARTADLSEANAELARAARLKDEFMASMSHELRTPLNAILGISEALQEGVYGALNENQSDSLKSVEESGRHLLTLINDILDLSKIEAGKFELELGVVSVPSICHSSLLFVKQNAQKKGLQLESELDESVHSIHVDARRLKQMLVNLLSNAVKFTPVGGQLGLEVVGDPVKGVVNFTVWDTGIGIAADDMKRLFRPFVQLDSSLSRHYVGTGLGLSLVYRMAELHGGSVSVESKVGAGSRFTISLPWEHGAEVDWSVSPAETTPLEPRDLPPSLRALVVEDATSEDRRLVRQLEELGVCTMRKASSEDILHIASEANVDVVALDIVSPGSDSWALMPLLKASNRTQTIPILVVSTSSDRTRALSLGAAFHLARPVSRPQLQHALNGMTAETVVQESAGVLCNGNGSHVSPRGGSILIAEDNEINIIALRDYLSAQGYQVRLARNGSEAIKRVSERVPDVILMDIQMPGMDGIEAMRRIRADSDLQTVPIIALTALTMPGDKERCLEAGADVYISKPVNFKHLVTTIDSLKLRHG